MNKRINKLDVIKIKIFYSAKINVKKMRREDKPYTERKYLQKKHLIKDYFQNIQGTRKT